MLVKVHPFYQDSGMGYGRIWVGVKEGRCLEGHGEGLSLGVDRVKVGSEVAEYGGEWVAGERDEV